MLRGAARGVWIFVALTARPLSLFARVLRAPSALNESLITESDIDTVLRRLFRVRIRLGHFDPDGALQTIGPDQVCMPSSLELARDGARQSIVLLKNVNSVLPLSLSRWTGSSVLMVGPNSNLSDVKGYYGSKQACGNSNDTPFSALQQWLPGASSIKGVPV